MRENSASNQRGINVQAGSDRMYVYRLRYFIGAMIASLARISYPHIYWRRGRELTGGTGKDLRAFSFLGHPAGSGQNAAFTPDQDIATPDLTVRVLIVHTRKIEEIARGVLETSTIEFGCIALVMTITHSFHRESLRTVYPYAEFKFWM